MKTKQQGAIAPREAAQVGLCPAQQDCALDSARRRDENGYLHVAFSNLTKEQVVPYQGREIPGWEALGLDPERVYAVYRPGAELEKAVPTFNGLPVLNRHTKDSAFDPQKALRVGATGTSAAFDGTNLGNALVFHDAEAIARIESGEQKELSAGYRYDPVVRSGVFLGQPYDLVMTNIRGNHIALVREGRAGPDVVVADKKPFFGGSMKLSLLAKRIVAALRGNPGMAMDGDPAQAEALVAEAVKEVVEQAAEAGGQPVLELDGEKDVASAGKDGAPATDSETAKDNETAKNVETAKDDGMAAKLKTLLAPLLEGKTEIGGKGVDAWLAELATALAPAPASTPAQDQEMAKDAKFKGKTPAKPATTVGTLAVRVDTSTLAEDAASIASAVHQSVTAQFKAKEEAALAVKPLVGDISVLAFDSAEDIYAHALKQQGMDVSRYDRAALGGIVRGLIDGRRAMAPAYALTQDAKPSGPLADVDFSRFSVEQ